MNINYVHTFERPENAVDRGTLKVNVIDRRTKRPVMNARNFIYRPAGQCY